MTSDPGLMQIGTRNSLLHKFATSRSFKPLSGPIFFTLVEVVERYRGQVSEGTLRNWRSMRIGPSFIKIGKAILAGPGKDNSPRMIADVESFWSSSLAGRAARAFDRGLVGHPAAITVPYQPFSRCDQGQTT